MHSIIKAISWAGVNASFPKPAFQMLRIRKVSGFHSCQRHINFACWYFIEVFEPFLDRSGTVRLSVIDDFKATHRVTQMLPKMMADLFKV